MKFAELMSVRALGIPRHALENTELIACIFDPDDVVNLLNSAGSAISPFALATSVHALVEQYDYKTCSRAFERARFNVINSHRQ